eukprot:scaffold158836_cov57-Attheya_sp.AAC.2
MIQVGGMEANLTCSKMWEHAVLLGYRFNVVVSIDTDYAGMMMPPHLFQISDRLFAFLLLRSQSVRLRFYVWWELVLRRNSINATRSLVDRLRHGIPASKTLLSSTMAKFVATNAKPKHSKIYSPLVSNSKQL